MISTADEIQIMSLIVTGIGVLIALVALIWQSYLYRQQIKLNFFSEYTKRYQEICLNLPFNINEPNFDFTKIDVEVKEKTIRYMRAYFDLCSEEYFLFLSGKISKKVWNEWKEGIEYTFSKKAFKDAWVIVHLDSRFYGKFVKWINEDVLK